MCPTHYAHAQSTENKYLFQVPPVPWSFTRSHHDVVERPVGTAVQRKADSNRHTCLSLCQPPPPLQLRVVGYKVHRVARTRVFLQDGCAAAGTTSLTTRIWIINYGGKGRAAATEVHSEPQLRPTWRVRRSYSYYRRVHIAYLPCVAAAAIVS